MRRRGTAAFLYDGREKGGGAMYYIIGNGVWQKKSEVSGQEEGLLGIFPYEEMLSCGKKWGIAPEMRKGSAPIRLSTIQLKATQTMPSVA